MITARLMLAGGSGRLVRRPSVVLFDPTGQNLDLAARFDAAESDSDAVDGLKKYLIESGFTAAPLVVAQWQQGAFNLLVFGDVEVHTSAIAAPMVSGMGSSTWVERHLGEFELEAASTVEVWSGEAADPTTNLGLGVVACAGFRMSLDFAEGGGLFAAGTQGAEAQGQGALAEDRDGHTIRTVPPAPRERLVDATVSAHATSSPAVADQASTDERDTDQPGVEQPAESVGRPVASVAAPILNEPIASPTVAVENPAVENPATENTAVGATAVDAPAVTNAAGIDTAKPDAAEIDTEEPVDPFTTSAPAAAQSKSVEAEPAASPAVPAAVPEDEIQPAGDFDPDQSVTEGAPVVAAAADASPRAGLIEAAYCSTGHPNPPRAAACYVCGLSLIEDQSLGLIEQPAVGRIAFSGGQQVPIERPIMMGRKPDAESVGAHPVLIDHVEVSRSHALITIEGWTVLLTDQGSRNGTWIVPPNDPTPVRLDSNVPHVLEHGTTVHLGAPEVAFTYYFDA